MRFSRFLLGVSLFTTVGLGCDDTTTSGGSGIAGSKKLSELSSAEVKRLCTSVQTKFDRIDEAFTEVFCTQFSYGEDTCKADRTECIDDPPAEAGFEETMDFSCSDADDNSIDQECPSITVDEFTACSEGLVTTIEKFADSFTCDTDPLKLSSPTAPKACTELGSRCPTLSDISFDEE